MSGLSVTVRSDVVTVCLDGTRKNALNQERYDALKATARAVVPGQILVIRAEGPHFCAGQDLDEHRRVAEAGRAEGALRNAADAILALLRCPGLVVVAAQGAAVGAGALIVAAADVVLLSEDAWLALPELRLGMPLGASVAERLLPAPTVRRMMLTGARIGADQVARAGAAAVHPPALLAQATDEAVAALLALDQQVAGKARTIWGNDERERSALAYAVEVAASVDLLRGTSRGDRL